MGLFIHFLYMGTKFMCFEITRIEVVMTKSHEYNLQCLDYKTSWQVSVVVTVVAQLAERYRSGFSPPRSGFVTGVDM